MEKANRGRANSAFNRYKPHSWECEFLLSALTRRLRPARGVFRSTAPAAAARGRWRGTGRDGAVLPGPRAAPQRSAAGRAAAPGWAAMLGECGAVGSAGASLRGRRSRPDSRVPIVASRRGGAGCSAGGLVCFSEVYLYFFLGSPVVACPGSAHGALRWRAAAHLCHRAFLNAVFCKLGIPALGPPLQLLQLRSWLSSVSHSP